MRKLIFAALITLPLAGCLTFQQDIAAVKAAAKTGGQAALATLDAMCPQLSEASVTINSPTLTTAAQTYFGTNNVTKNLNNINDGISVLADACAARNAKTAAAVILAGAKTLNDITAIVAISQGK